MSATPDGVDACGLEYKHCIFLSHSYRNRSTEVASRPIHFKCNSSAFLFVEVVPHNQGLVLLTTDSQILLHVAPYLHGGDESVKILLAIWRMI